MRAELRALKPVLERTVGETTALMSRIAHEKAAVVEPKKAVVDAEVAAADAKAQEARAIKEEVRLRVPLRRGCFGCAGFQGPVVAGGFLAAAVACKSCAMPRPAPYSAARAW